MNKNKKQIVNEFISLGVEETPMSLKDVVELTGISIRTEPVTEDFTD
jgi:hypothetical protein